MHWLSFFIGALVGWLICWLIDYLICRPRRMSAEALLNASLEQRNEESAELTAQLSDYEDLQVRLDAANAEIGTLQARIDGMNEAQASLEAANAEIDALKMQLAQTKDVRADLVGWKAKATQQSLEIERLNAQLAAGATAGAATASADMGAPEAPEAQPEEPSPFIWRPPGAEAAPSAPAAQPAEPDDLTRIEGIGPKISQLLNQDGLYTFAQLAAASVEHLQSILSAAGSRFRLADPQTWPEQASFARDGKWEALQAFQDTLKAGRVV